MFNPNTSTNRLFADRHLLHPQNLQPSVVWSQTVPNDMPWMVSSFHDNQPNIEHVKHFTALPNQAIGPMVGKTDANTIGWQLVGSKPWTGYNDEPIGKPVKRNSDASDFDEVDSRPCKQFINEDKVIEIFDDLHISKKCDKKSDDLNPMPLDAKIIDDENKEKSNQVKCDDATLFIADEVQQALNSKTFMDKIIKDELDKHSKAVVLWQPPPSTISPEIKSRYLLSDDEDSGNRPQNKLPAQDNTLHLDEFFDDVLMGDCESTDEMEQ